MPATMIMTPSTRPVVVWGTMSPYPTVVRVTTAHQSASPNVSNPGLVACSAWYATSAPMKTTPMATSDTYPRRSNSRRAPACGHHQPGHPRQPDEDDELAGPGADDEEPGRGQDHHHEVETPHPRPEVVHEPAFVDHEVDEEHQPRGDEHARRRPTGAHHRGGGTAAGPRTGPAAPRCAGRSARRLRRRPVSAADPCGPSSACRSRLDHGVRGAPHSRTASGVSRRTACRWRARRSRGS